MLRAPSGREAQNRKRQQTGRKKSEIKDGRFTMAKALPEMQVSHSRPEESLRLRTFIRQRK